MRTKPSNSHLGRLPLFMRDTKHGRSGAPNKGAHASALPSSPAMEVNVPHSWATTSGCAGPLSLAALRIRAAGIRMARNFILDLQIIHLESGRSRPRQGIEGRF